MSLITMFTSNKGSSNQITTSAHSLGTVTEKWCDSISWYHCRTCICNSSDHIQGCNGCVSPRTKLHYQWGKSTMALAAGNDWRLRTGWKSTCLGENHLVPAWSYVQETLNKLKCCHFSFWGIVWFFYLKNSVSSNWQKQMEIWKKTVVS